MHIYGLQTRATCSKHAVNMQLRHVFNVLPSANYQYGTLETFCIVSYAGILNVDLRWFQAILAAINCSRRNVPAPLMRWLQATRVRFDFDSTGVRLFSRGH